MYKINITREFEHDFAKLTQPEQEAVERAIFRLREDSRYRGLRVQKMMGRKNVWEARASRDLRLLFSLDGQTILLHKCGHHAVENR